MLNIRATVQEGAAIDYDWVEEVCLTSLDELWMMIKNALNLFGVDRLIMLVQELNTILS